MTTLAWYRHGPTVGLPLVLLHAFPVDARMWGDVVAVLSDVPIVTVDAPGFGGSLAAVGVPTLEDYADAVVETVRVHGVERAVVAGLSMGGYTAMAIAERNPSFLAGIGLLDTKASADDDDARANRLAVADAAQELGSAAVVAMVDAVLCDQTRAARPDVVEQIAAWIDEAPADGITWAQRAMAARPDRHDALRALTVPALVLRGDADAMSPAGAAASMAEALGAHTITVPGAGHMSANEQPQAVADALADLYRAAAD